MTNRKVIARVVGVAPDMSLGLPPELAQMVADGKLTPGNGTPLTLDLPTPVQLSGDVPSVSEMALQDRGPR